MLSTPFYFSNANAEQAIMFTGQDLESSVYRITLNPGVHHWRFEIGFTYLNNMLKSIDGVDLECPDLVFENGNFKEAWEHRDMLFSSHEPVKVGHTHVHAYQAGTVIDFYLQYLPTPEVLSVNYKLCDGTVFSTLVSLKPGFDIVLSASGKDESLDMLGKIETIELAHLESKESSFKVDNLRFRKGGVFDYSIISRCNFIIIPVSVDGLVSRTFAHWLIDNGIDPPKKAKAGTLAVQKLNTPNGIYHFGFAYVFDRMGSLSAPLVDMVIQKMVKHIKQHYVSLNGISMPMLMDERKDSSPLDFVVVLLDHFRRSGLNLEVVLSIENKEILSYFRTHFSRDYTFVPQSEDFVHPKILSDFLLKTGNNEDDLYYEINLSRQIISLSIHRIKILNKGDLEPFIHLRSLSIFEGYLGNLDFLMSMKNLQSLSLTNTSIYDFTGLICLEKLKYLDLSATGFKNLNILAEHKSLETLNLRDLGLYELELSESLENLQSIDASYNRLADVSNLANFKNIASLNLMGNNLTDISFIKRLPRLDFLNVRENRIADVSFLLSCKQLVFLFIDKNPVERAYGLNLTDLDNHLFTIRNLLLKREEANKVAVSLPVKVLLLGNHSSGKSSLLFYLHNGVLSEEMPSTHVINISSYPIGDEIPRAIFYDFGGQDYYHGIYRAFLSGGAAYLLLYQTATNKNQTRLDSHELLTQDFKLDYWLAQKQYLENQVYESNDPLFLIQTHAESDMKEFCDTTCHFGTTIQNDFLISLKYGETEGDGFRNIKHFHALAHLKASIDELIESLQTTNLLPEWNVKFLKHILGRNREDDHNSVDLEELMPYYLRDGDDILMLMRDDLDQLHRQGLIIYYKHVLPGRAWLNPVALTKYIHNDILSSHSLKTSLGRISPADIEDFDSHIIELLVLQKVIFYHAQGDEYIVPNFLPLATQDDPDFIMMTFGLSEPLFVLKFKNFLPFGIINQIICAFGSLPHQKKFWRDQIIFTFEDCVKVLIRIDFQLLEIKVFASFFAADEYIDKKSVTRYIFYGLLATYWDFELLSFENFESYRKGFLKSSDFNPNDRLYNSLSQAESIYSDMNCRPLDLYISLDDSYFLNYSHLCAAENDVQIQVQMVDENRAFIDDRKSVAIYQFQPFALKQLKNPKKAVISYSKKDLHLVEKFKQYILPLADEGLIEDPWYCTELIAGSPWNETIQQKFDNADIIFFMISEHLFSTPYIREHEIKKAIERYERDKSLMIVPILLVHYRFGRTGRYDLSQFTGLPYTMMPVTSFEDQNMAWYFVCEGIRIMIENQIDPGSENGRQNDQMKQFFQMVMDKRVHNIQL